MSVPSRTRTRRAAAALAATGLVGLGVATALPHADAAPEAAAPAASAAKVRVVTYQGDGVTVRRAKHQLGRLADTSKDFQLAMKKDLDELWGYTDNDPKCASAPVVIVKKWRSDGWATLSDEGVFAPCPQGGAQAIWHTIDGTWQRVLGTQDVPKCIKLRSIGVPKNMWKQCYAGGKVVRYTGP